MFEMKYVKKGELEIAVSELLNEGNKVRHIFKNNPNEEDFVIYYESKKVPVSYESSSFNASVIEAAMLHFGD